MSERPCAELFEAVESLTSKPNAGEAVIGPPRLEAIDRDQLVLRPVNVEELVRPDDEVRAIWEVVGRFVQSFMPGTVIGTVIRHRDTQTNLNEITDCFDFTFLKTIISYRCNIGWLSLMTFLSCGGGVSLTPFISRSSRHRSSRSEFT